MNKGYPVNLIFIALTACLLSSQLSIGQSKLIEITDAGIAKHASREYDSAFYYFDLGVKVAEELSGKKSCAYEDAVLNLGTLLSDIGRYEDAEQLLLESVQLGKEIHGSQDSSYAINLSYLGIFYRRVGNYPKAEQTYLEAKSIFEQYPQLLHSRCANLLNSLATLYFYMGDFPKSRQFMEEGCSIMKKRFGSDSRQYARLLSYLGTIYNSLGFIADARKAEVEALQILEKKDVQGQINVARINLGTIEVTANNPDKGEREFLDVKKHTEKFEGPFNQLNHTVNKALAKVYRLKRNKQKGSQFELSVIDGINRQVELYFPFFSDMEREHFYKTLRTDIDAFNSFCTENPDSILLGRMFDEQLATKALLLNTSGKWKQRIKTSGDKKLFQQYLEWEMRKATLNAWNLQFNASRKMMIDSLEQLCNAQEKQLSKRSAAFAKLNQKRKITWRDLRTKLSIGEVAIEMIRVPKWGIKKWMTDSTDAQLPLYPEYGSTDTISYVALIVHANSKSPEMVLLRNGNYIENRGYSFYINSIQTQQRDSLSYDLFWKPIEDRIKKLLRNERNTTIYFSADGVYHKINLNTLYNPKSKTYLFERFNVKLVTNCREILETSASENTNKLAYIFSNPDFAARKPNSQSDNLRGGLSPLPSTEKEAQDIFSILKSKGWQVDLFLGPEATEDALKDCYRPGVLHLATHGFFDARRGRNLGHYSTSGLFLSQKAESAEDGLLNPYEIVNLNLDDTDLVVLSACETGLGDVQNGEGVYGLQRAFKVAGAKAIIMSLWKIDDAVTQKLMTSFYRNWGNTGDKAVSLRLAQKEIMNEYPQPFYWGGFVGLGL